MKSATTRRKRERGKKSDARKLAAKWKGKIRPASPSSSLGGLLGKKKGTACNVKSARYT